MIYLLVGVQTLFTPYHRRYVYGLNFFGRLIALSLLLEMVSVLLDQGKHVEASAVMGQVDGMLKELDPPPEWLLRDVDVQAARLAAVTQ